MTVTHDLKRLQTQLSEAQADVLSIEKDLEIVRSKLQWARQRRDAIVFEIKQLTSNAETPVVSEHALLRYIERFMNVDLDGVRQMILSKRVVNTIRAIRSGRFTADGMQLVVKDGVIVTVAHKDE